MSTSGSTSWELTRDNIIYAALRKLGVLNKGATPDSTTLSTAQTALNGVISRFNTLGMPLWKRNEESVTLVAATSSYTLTNALKVTGVYIRNTSSSVQYEIDNKSEYDISRMPYSATGLPSCWSFTPNISEGGTLRVWPIPDSSAASNYTLRVLKQKEMETFTASGETPDFPPYWSDAVIFALAVSLAPEYSLPLNDRNELKQQAKEYLEQAKGYSDEDGSLFIQPYIYPR